ncbi:DNA primase [Geitlerinema sp. FC II]|nr:DNA primase [Geitlerinema sp. FC II]
MSYTKQLTTDCQSSPTPDRCVSLPKSTTEEEIQQFTTSSQKSSQTQSEHLPSSESTQNRGENRTSCPPWIDTAHWRELTAESAIDGSLAALNCRYLDGDEAIERFLRAIDTAELTKRTWIDAQWRDIRRRFGHLEQGALFFESLDPSNDWKLKDWVRIKPNRPKLGQNGKLIKYQSPPKHDTELFFARVTWGCGYRIAKRHGYASEYERRMVEAYRTRSPKQDAGEGFGKTAQKTAKPKVRPDLLYAIHALGLDASFLNTENAGFWPWVHSVPDFPIVLTEGEKKAMSLLSHGYAAISAPGIYMFAASEEDESYRKQFSLRPDLIPFAVKGRRFYIAFDEDKKLKTVLAVSHATERTSRLLEKQGCEVRVVLWNGKRGKGVDDLIAIQGADAFARAFERAVPAVVACTRHHWGLGDYAVAKTVNARYIPTHIKPPRDRQLVCLKSPKNTGKTHWLTEQIADLNDEYEKSHGYPMPVVVLSHRRQLAKALGERFGLRYVTELRDGEGDLFGFSLCLDSAHAQSQAQFDPNRYHDAIVVLDEIEQQLMHLFASNTEISKHRITVMRNLKILFENVFDSEHGQVFVADADLSRHAIDWILDIADARRSVFPWILENTWKESDRSCHLFTEPNPNHWLYQLVAQVRSGGRPFVQVSGQKASSKWGTQSLETFCRREFPDKRILRIDSDTVADTTHPACGCIANLNEILGDYDIVIASPAIETGLDIKIKGHFSANFVLAWGQQGVNSVRQAMFRLRDNVPRYVWVPRIATIGRLGRNAKTKAKYFRVVEQKKMFAALDLLLKQKALRTSEAQAEQFHREVRSALAASEPSENVFSALVARENAGFIAYRETLRYELEEEGYTVKDVGLAPDDDKLSDLLAKFQAARDDNHQAEIQAICDAKPVSEDAYEKLKRSNARSPQARHQIRKFELSKRYATDEITPKLIERDDDGWYGLLTKHYQLTRGRKFVEFKDEACLTKAFGRDGGLWTWDVNRQCKSVTVKGLEVLGVGAFVRAIESEPDHLWTADDPKLLHIVRQIEKFPEAREIVPVHGRNQHGVSPIATANSLLKEMGLKLERSSRTRFEGKIIWLYKLAAEDKDGNAIGLNDGRMEVFDRWYERDTREQKKVEAEIDLILENRTPVESDNRKDNVLTNFEVREVEVKSESSLESFTSQGIEGCVRSYYIINILFQQPVPGMQEDSLGHPKDFLLHSQPTRISDPIPRRLNSTGIFDLPLPTATDDLSTRHITGLDRTAVVAVMDSSLEVFTNLCPTIRTFLRSATGIHLAVKDIALPAHPGKDLIHKLTQSSIEGVFAQHSYPPNPPNFGGLGGCSF